MNLPAHVLAPARLEIESLEIEAAVQLVETGGAPRVIVAGLEHVSELASRFRVVASACGVAIEPGERPTEIVIRARPAILPAE